MSKNKLNFAAFVLVGGKGTRLRSVVYDRPKPMADVFGKPFLEIIIRLLAAKGINKFVLLAGYKANEIESYFNRAEFRDFDIGFSHESEPLGTGGAVRNAQEFATEPTLLVNGDTYFDIDIDRFCAYHALNKADVTISLFKVPDVSRYGSVSVTPDGIVTSFHEKDAGRTGTGLINAGMSLLSKAFIADLPDQKSFSMETEVFPKFVNTGKMFGLEQKGPFFDIGTPESYFEFCKFAQFGQ
jgi:D-glycero-alpha-D-manno-heptose 1-phosphate guanylyltransferase